MEGIPPEDLKDHEKQHGKNGNRSDSDDDEPATKKVKPGETGLPPQLMMPNMVPPGMQFQLGPMAMVSPYLQLGLPPHMLGAPPRALFPSAATSAMSVQAKPTFPAYSNATISAPPTTNLGIPHTSNTDNKTNSKETSNNANTNSNENPQQKPSTVPSAGTASKIMHPSEDVSLEELRSRKPQYKIIKQTVVSSSPHSTISTSIHHSTPSTMTTTSNTNKLVAAAQEVFQHVNMNFFFNL